MAEAKAKADTLAAAAGVSIAGVSSIAETSSPIQYPVPFAADGAIAAPDAAKVPTPIQAGTNDVTITVSVVYLIK